MQSRFDHRQQVEFEVEFTEVDYGVLADIVLTGAKDKVRQRVPLTQFEAELLLAENTEVKEAYSELIDKYLDQTFSLEDAESAVIAATMDIQGIKELLQEAKATLESSATALKAQKELITSYEATIEKLTKIISNQGETIENLRFFSRLVY